MPLSKRSSTFVQEKHGTIQIPLTKEESPPPAYTTGNSVTEPPDITAAFPNLTLGSSVIPEPDHCIAHLKLLEALHQHREDIALHDGLFNIWDSYVFSRYSDLERAKILTQIREKRWAIYIAKAVKRFECWWRKCIQPDAKNAEWTSFGSQAFTQDPGEGRRMKFEKENIPPLDVIIVWHAYQLNPRDFLEDCIRYGKMEFWRAGLPWAAIDACINKDTFDFEAPLIAMEAFTARTGLPWDSNDDLEPDKTTLLCPAQCNTTLRVAWTSTDHPDMWKKRDDSELEAEHSGRGLADKHFRVQCPSCGQIVDHDMMKLQKFGEDISILERKKVPMPGTILSINGKPEKPINFDRHPSYFPNRVVYGREGKDKSRRRDLQQFCPQFGDVKGGFHNGRTRKTANMSAIREVIEKYLADRDYIKGCNHTFTAKLQREEKISIRKMMSHYWENSSVFGLDLVGAVIRQGTFVEKMHSIDWLHSPSCSATMKRLIQKYTRYIEIIAFNPSSVAVPTLDVDLAWHTHQLSPPAYYDYTTQKTKTFIDHDDKIDETKLSTSFEWTSKTYQKMYNEVYSECTCWYCEAIRESHTSSLSRAFGSNKAIDSQLDRLHSGPQPVAGSPGPHVSAHNAIKSDALGQDIRKATYRAKQEKDYQKAVQHAIKKGRRPPTRDDHNHAYMAYGYPMYVPYYAPYMGDPCVSGGMYPSNPSCATFVVGAAGNCCQGACGGGVAAGSCGSGAAGCAGGACGSAGGAGAYVGGGGFGGGGCAAGGGCGGGGGGG